MKPLIKENILDCIVECGKIFDEQPIATGARFILDPHTGELLKAHIGKPDKNGKIGSTQDGRYDIYEK